MKPVSDTKGLETIIWLREVDVGTDNACWVVCANGDPGAVPFVPLAALSQLRTQVEGLEARCADYEADLAEGRQAARNFGVEIDDDDDEPKWWIAAVVVANRASPSLQDERERAAREEERERCAISDDRIAPANLRAWMTATPFAICPAWKDYVDHMLKALSPAAIRQERGDKT